MRRVLQFVAKLYPDWWRRRYGAEFEALLEDTKPRWRDVADILKGAIEMQMSFTTRAALVLACGITGAALTFGASFLMQPKYESSTILVLEGPSLPQSDINEFRSATALAGIIEARGLYQRERSRESMGAVVDRMNRAIQINPISQHVAKISFTYEDPALAQATIMDLAREFFNKVPVKAVESPGLPRRAVSPARMNMAIVGLGAGLLLALVLLVILPSPQRLHA